MRCKSDPILQLGSVFSALVECIVREPINKRADDLEERLVRLELLTWGFHFQAGGLCHAGPARIPKEQ